MLLKVRLNSRVEDFEVSKAMSVESFKKLVQEKFDIEPARQRLIYSGKQLADGNDLIDYRVGNSHVVTLMERVVLGEVKEPVNRMKKAPSPSSSDSGCPSSPPRETIEQLRDICPSLAEEVAKEEEEPPCKVCSNNARRKCKECGCSVCGGKDDPDTQLFCEECQYVTHMRCLNPPLEAIPEDDWYCPDCRNDANEIINVGEKIKLTAKTSKMASRIAKAKNQKIRDWGRGDGCSGRRKECTKVPPTHFGPIPGIEVGMCWESRMQLSEEGVHRPPVSGIAGRAETGAPSIVLSGGYEDDTDNGIEFTYTGAGGRDLEGNKRMGAASHDQTLERSNLALARCCAAPINAKEGAKATNWKAGKPVRVSRSYKLLKRSDFAPEEGYRYDGTYKVVKYWPQTSKTGFMIWRYLLRRDDDAKAPWEKGAKKFKMIPKVKNEKRKLDSEEAEPESKKAKMEVYKVDKKYKDVIAKDEKNAKMWEECLGFEAETLLDWLNKVEEHFTCICCSDILHKPVTTECGHNLCQFCYQRSIKAEHLKCPVCRTDFEKNLVVNNACSTALKTLFPGYDAERK